jgi:phage recombination protein Bet
MKKKLEKIEEAPASEKKEMAAVAAVIERTDIAPADAFGKLTRAQIELIKRTVAKDASDDELRLFIQVCKGARLNPFMRQAHLVPFWDSRAGVERRSIIVGIDGLRAVAENGGKYAGNDDPIFAGEKVAQIKVKAGGKEEERGLAHPEMATVSVYKVVDGQRYAFTATARWNEYYPGERKGGQWHIRPFLMLGKCAEALALRKAFPTLMSGIYVQEEMDRAMSADGDEQKNKKAYDTLIKAIEKCDVAQLESYREKMSKSDKYDDEQKVEFAKKVDSRIAEIKAATVKLPETTSTPAA